jgi:hypothetical protein
MRNQVSLRRRQESRVRNFRIGAVVLLTLFAAVLGTAVCQGAVANDPAATSLGALPFLAIGGLMFQNKPDDSAGGGSSPQPPAPEGTTIEEKLQSSIRHTADFFKQLGGAMKEKDDEIAAHAITKQSLKDEQTAHGVTKQSLKDEQTAHAATKDQFAGANDRATKAEGRVTLIESYAKHHSLDLAGLENFKAAKTPADANPNEGGNAEGKAAYDKWQALKKTDSAAATAFFRDNKKLLREYSKSLK